LTVRATLTRLTARLQAFFRPDALDEDFTQELESHLDLLADENVRRGMTPEDARRAALIRLGAPTSLKAQHRDVRGLPALDTVLQDLRFAVRLLAKDRWYSAAAVAALALGIGANTAGFTIVNAALLQGLPYEDADRLYVISPENRSGRRASVSYEELHEWRVTSRSFSALAAYRNASVNISSERAVPEEVNGTWLTANAFGVLREPPILGRDLTSADERADAGFVVLIGYELWHRRYAGDPAVLGQLLRVNGQPATIVGIMAEGMKFPDDSDIWLPLILPEPETSRTARVLRVFGRLRDGVEPPEARAEMTGIAQQLAAAYPDPTNVVGVRVETFTDRFIGGAGRVMFLTVMGAVILVLVIACANVANLLLSRSTARAREIAVRVALGATRWRVIRQLLLESLLLSAIGGAIGLVLANVGVRMFGVAMQQGGFPYWVVFEVNYVVFIYVAVICVVTAMLFGLAPAWYASKASGTGVLKDAARGTTRSHRVLGFGSAMVLTELTLTTTLLVGAGLMIRSFMTLYSVDLGIRVDGAAAMDLRLPESKYATPDARRAFFDRLEPRVAAIPGIEAVAITNGVPPNDGGERLLEVDAASPAADQPPIHVGTVTITPAFFEAVGVHLISGRTFQSTDGGPGAEAVIVNERLAAQFFPGADPIGHRLRFVTRAGASNQSADRWRTIVGIVPTIKHGSPQDHYENAVVYIPYRQETPAGVSLLVRSSLPPESTINAVRRAVQAIDPDQPVQSMRTLSQVLAETRWWWRTWGAVFGVFAVIAVVLSAVGLYAVIAYSVAQRTPEIGIRMALGAQPGAVCWMVLRRAVVQLAIGLTLGLTGAFVWSDVLWGGGVIVTTPADPTTYLAIAILLSVVSLTASLLPARRAMRVDPVTALRTE
jgi:putative ABC transport system permease protein